MTESFRDSVVACLASIPTGRVATCGAIARALGDVRAARAVWTWIRDHPTTLFAHRAVRGDGRPVLPSAIVRLRREGIRAHASRVPRTRFAESLAAVGLFDRLRGIQEAMEARVSVQDDFAGPGVVGGVDAAYRGDIAYIAAATVDSDARTIQVAGMTLRAEFPYVPTYFAFREMPAIEAIVKALDPRPDILLIDGHGRLHPRRFGIACHVGVALDLPTIGVAKHRLEGRVDEGDAAVRPVRLDARIEGYAWTPRGRSRPLYISPGHRISPESALAIVRMATRGKGPEPLRLADVTARKRKDSEKRETGSEA